jgi:hypothetical protein
MSKYIALSANIRDISLFKTSWIFHLYIILLLSDKDINGVVVFDRMAAKCLLNVGYRSINKGLRDLSDMGVIEYYPLTGDIVILYNPLAVEMPASAVLDMFNKL